MTDLKKLYEILGETTVQLRKGAEVVESTTGSIQVTEIFDMPPVEAARPDLTMIDLHFLSIGVDKVKAEDHRAELIEILDSLPQDVMSGGPSYISVGGLIGDQGAAFQLFALGEALGLWKVITPKTLGATGPMADQLAGSGYIMISGYRHET